MTHDSDKSPAAALLAAARSGDVEALLVALEAGADPSESFEGKPSAFHQAIFYGQTACVAALLPAADLEARDNTGNRAIDLALKYQKGKLILKLIEMETASRERDILHDISRDGESTRRRRI